MSAADRFFIGLPAWAYAGWRGPYFPTDRPPLESYSKVFNTVEGNTSFYATPSEKSVAGWCEQLADRRFRFCFKLPKSVTHERRPSLSDLRTFFARVEPLGEHLGPFMIQLPATVGPEELPDLTRLVERLPRSHRYVIEFRHRALFEEPDRVEELLDEFSLGRVMVDSRPIYEGDRAHPEVLDALHEKPDVPVLDTVYNSRAFIRLILHPDLTSNPPYLDFWADRCASYLAEGHEVSMLIHCPNNQHCPDLAEDFHARLRARVGATELPALPSWPVPQQTSLI